MKTLVSSILFSLILPNAFTQTASLNGTITGADDREGLVNVNIIVEGTILGTVSGYTGIIPSRESLKGNRP